MVCINTPGGFLTFEVTTKNDGTTAYLADCCNGGDTVNYASSIDAPFIQ